VVRICVSFRFGEVMDKEPFDPDNIRIEDTFRAKEERRKRLANLPFEEKIEIVKRLQTVARTIRKEREGQKTGENEESQR
jgi:hypothetical protein